jgi:RNA polymerase sigma-70 factor (family 1)
MPDQTDYNENLILNNLRAGSREAFEEIFKRFWNPLYVMARSKVQSREEAEEIVQSIFSALWEKRATLVITNLSFYLQTAVRNRIINSIRSKITEHKYWEYYKAFMPQYKESTEDTVAFNALNEAVEKAVDRLPEKSKLVFKLSRLEGWSITEIARHLKLSEKAIEYHLTKSLKQLRIHLKDFILSALMIVNALI